MKRNKNRWLTSPKKDKTGLKYGRLKVISFSHYKPKKTGGRSLWWRCVCECGEEKIVENSNLVCGSVKSCGCLIRDSIKKVHKGNINKNAAFMAVMKEYIRHAKDKNMLFELTKEQFKNLTKGNCNYCGIEPKTIKDRNGPHIYKDSVYVYNGIDRVDNMVGYVEHNCVSCCRDCNVAKGTKTSDEFFEWANRLHNNIKKMRRKQKIEAKKYEKEECNCGSQDMADICEECNFCTCECCC